MRRKSFTSRAYLAWSLDRRIELVHIRPGKPIENSHVESFNGRLREECLNVSWFRNLFGARRQIETWRIITTRTGRIAALDIEHLKSSQRLVALRVNTVLGWSKGSQTPCPTPPSPLKPGCNR